MLDKMIANLNAHRIRAIGMNSYGLADDIIKRILKLYRLKEKLEQAEKRNAVIDSILS